jgi:fermentation-respiration switch protein FrsA (DUF1100 family)
MTPRQRRQRIRRWITAAVLVALYGLAALIAPRIADGMLFHPSAGTMEMPPGGFYIPQSNGEKLAAVYLPNPSARSTLWYFHGNAETISDAMPRLQAYQKIGFAVFALEYPGYGRSDGWPSEASIYASSRTALSYLEKELKTPSSQIVLYGRSLGGGPAVELAAHENVKGLVLESAFKSAYRIMTHWGVLPFDRFENIRKMPNVRCQVLIIQGRSDGVVPFSHGQALLDEVRSRKSHLWVDGAGHNNVLELAGDEYWKALREFEQGL